MKILSALTGAAFLAAGSAVAQEMPGMDHSKMDHSKPAPPASADPHAGHDMPGMDMNHAMTGALGPYPMTREASGTSWQPDASTHEGLQVMRGPWMVMVVVAVFVVVMVVVGMAVTGIVHVDSSVLGQPRKYTP